MRKVITYLTHVGGFRTLGYRQVDFMGLPESAQVQLANDGYGLRDVIYQVGWRYDESPKWDAWDTGVNLVELLAEQIPWNIVLEWADPQVHDPVYYQALEVYQKWQEEKRLAEKEREKERQRALKEQQGKEDEFYSKLTKEGLTRRKYTAQLAGTKEGKEVTFKEEGQIIRKDRKETQFFVHKDRGHFVLSHLPTGKSVATFHKMKDLLELTGALLNMDIDWDNLNEIPRELLDFMIQAGELQFIRSRT